MGSPVHQLSRAEMKRFVYSPDNPNRERVLSTLCEFVRGCGSEVWVTVAQPKRTSAENRMLHALIAELARKMEWAGKKRDAETWKRLLVAAWCRTTGTALELLPAIDGHGFDVVPARTSGLTKRECAELIDFVQWFGAENGVEFETPEIAQ